MKFEPVIMMWDYFDGARTGMAEFNGIAHYFDGKFDETLIGFPEDYELSPVCDQFLKSAHKQWKIYRDWQFKFRQGLEVQENHPGGRGTNPEYDRLQDELDIGIDALTPLPDRYIPEFRASATNQDHIPKGAYRDFEAKWRKSNI